MNAMRAESVHGQRLAKSPDPLHSSWLLHDSSTFRGAATPGTPQHLVVVTRRVKDTMAHRPYAVDASHLSLTMSLTVKLCNIVYLY